MIERILVLLLFFSSSKLTFSFDINKPPYRIKYNETGFKYCGFINITELGVGYRNFKKSNSTYTYGVTEIRTINGYQFNYNFSLGIGTGAILTFAGLDALMYPVTIDARIASGEGRKTAVLLLSGGMMLNNFVNPIFIFQPSIGIRNYVSENTAFVLSIGPKMLLQENSRLIRNFTGKNFTYLSVITVNAGFSF